MAGLFIVPALALMGILVDGAAAGKAGAKGAIALPANASPPPPALHPAPFLLARDGANERGDLRLAIDAAAVEALRHAHGPHLVDVPIDLVESLTLKLQRFEVISPDASFIVMRDGKAMHAAAPDMLLLSGEVVGEPGSHAFLALNDRGGGGGSITRDAGRSVHLVTDRVDGKASGLLVQSGPAVLPEFPEFCLVLDGGFGDANFGDAGADDGGIAGAPGVDPARGPRIVTVAIDSDESYSNLFNDDEDESMAYIVQLVGAVSDIYIRDLNIKLVLGFARLWPDGGEPFTADDVGGFRDYWQANEDTTGLNLVHMLSARRNLSYGGVAFLADACNGEAHAISGFLLGGFPSPVDEPNLGLWDVVVVAHEMGHNLGTSHTHSYDPPVDTCAFGSNERGTIMSYCHIRPGGLLNIDPRMHAVTQQIINAENAADECLVHDCNGNGIADTLDLAIDASFDIDGNGVPDECDDCNGNGTLDSLDLLAGEPDVNANLVPDSCEDDCNGNAVPDRWEIAQLSAEDLNGNNIPDSCEPDCDSNGVADFQDIHVGTYSDVDRDSVPDVCQDCNGNGLADWIDVDRQFNIFVGLSGGAVREYHAASGVLAQEHGVGAIQGAFDLAFGPDGALYVASFFTNQIIRVDVDSGQSTVFIDAGPQVQTPSSLVFGPDGNLYVAMQSHASVQKFSGVSGAAMGTFVAAGAGGLVTPWDLAFGPGGDLFIVSSSNEVLRYSGFTGDFEGVFISENLIGPRSILFLSGGDVLVTNYAGGAVIRYDSAGEPIDLFHDEYPVVLPWGIAQGRNGNIYFMRDDAQRLIEYDEVTGIYQRSFIRGDELLVNIAQFVFRPASANDANGNDVPDDCESGTCAADISPGQGKGGGDGEVGAADLAELLASWGPCAACPADIAPAKSGGDDVVGAADLAELLASWGSCP